MQGCIAGVCSIWCPQQDIFLPICLQSGQPSAYLGTWGCSSSAAGLGISLCWTSWLSPWPISQACWCPSGWQYEYLFHQPLPLAANLLWVHCDPITQVCSEEIKQYRSRYPNHNIPLAAGLQLDFVLLIRALWSQQFCQFSVHFTVHLIQSVLDQFVYDAVLGHSIKNQAKIRRKPHYGQDFQSDSARWHLVFFWVILLLMYSALGKSLSLFLCYALWSWAWGNIERRKEWSCIESILILSSMISLHNKIQKQELGMDHSYQIFEI